MTRPLRIALYALALLLAAPAIVALVDAWLWTMLAQQLTALDWSNEVRVTTTAVLAVMACAVVALLVDAEPDFPQEIIVFGDSQSLNRVPPKEE